VINVLDFVLHEQCTRVAPVYTAASYRRSANKGGKGGRTRKSDNVLSRLATAKVAGIQAAVTDGMLLAQPCEEALETETVAAVGRGAVPECEVSNQVLCELGTGMTYFLWSVYQ
jgi:hypothetical protein